jgi:hypothetical protein
MRTARSVPHGICSGCTLISRQFFIPWSKMGTTPPAALDAKHSEALWEWLERETKDKGLA